MIKNKHFFLWINLGLYFHGIIENTAQFAHFYIGELHIIIIIIIIYSLKVFHVSLADDVQFNIISSV